MTKLLPCPFCGGKAVLITGRTAEDAEMARTQCKQCFAESDDFEDAYAPTGEAVAAWNRRAPDPDTAAIKARAETLEDAMRKAVKALQGIDVPAFRRADTHALIILNCALSPYNPADDDLSGDGIADQKTAVPDDSASYQPPDADKARFDELGAPAWDVCKIAFASEADDMEQIWDAFGGKDNCLPDGWVLTETDCSGARDPIAIFDVEGIPSLADAAKVRSLIAALAKGGDHDH